MTISRKRARSLSPTVASIESYHGRPIAKRAKECYADGHRHGGGTQTLLHHEESSRLMDGDGNCWKSTIPLIVLTPCEDKAPNEETKSHCESANSSEKDDAFRDAFNRIGRQLLDVPPTPLSDALERQFDLLRTHETADRGVDDTVQKYRASWFELLGLRTDSQSSVETVSQKV